MFLLPSNVCLSYLLSTLPKPHLKYCHAMSSVRFSNGEYFTLRGQIWRITIVKLFAVRWTNHRANPGVSAVAHRSLNTSQVNKGSWQQQELWYSWKMLEKKSNSQQKYQIKLDWFLITTVICQSLTLDVKNCAPVDVLKPGCFWKNIWFFSVIKIHFVQYVNVLLKDAWILCMHLIVVEQPAVALCAAFCISRLHRALVIRCEYWVQLLWNHFKVREKSFHRWTVWMVWVFTLLVVPNTSSLVHSRASNIVVC